MCIKFVTLLFVDVTNVGLLIRPGRKHWDHYKVLPACNCFFMA